MPWSKESRQARGYGPAWDKLRKVILARDEGLCQCPDCQGGKKRLRLADEVNHKVSKAQAKAKGWTQAQIDDPSNLESVNKDCHKRITAAQMGRTQKPRIGLDGWPVAPT